MLVKTTPIIHGNVYVVGLRRIV